MRNQSKYWEKMFTQYRESGLTRPAFCKEQGLSYSQFQYQWYKQNEAVRVSTNQPLKQASAHIFEAIAITAATEETRSSSTEVELVICLPNQVRCEIRSGLAFSELPALLKQLVVLC